MTFNKIIINFPQERFMKSHPSYGNEEGRGSFEKDLGYFSGKS
jgi:hypothetical protein